jgi:hypothetical protein
MIALSVVSLLSLLAASVRAQNVIDGWLQRVGPWPVERIDQVSRNTQFSRQRVPVNKVALPCGKVSLLFPLFSLSDLCRCASFCCTVRTNAFTAHTYKHTA